jgi:DNA-binding transcriptional regulator YiaG
MASLKIAILIEKINNKKLTSSDEVSLSKTNKSESQSEKKAQHLPIKQIKHIQKSKTADQKKFADIS